MTEENEIKEMVVEGSAVVDELIVKPKLIGLDVGTNMLVSGSLSEDGKAIFKLQRDAFYRIIPKSEVNRNSIKMSLDRRGADYIIDEDGVFIIIGDDSLDFAIERHGTTERPLSKGVISPKNKKALPIVKLIIKNLIGEGTPGSKVVYSVPAKPIDQDFNVIYHQEILGMYFKELGYDSEPINEGFAVGLSELLNDGLTGITASWGAGMCNMAVLHEGDVLSEISITKSGDFIDNSVATALDMSPSLVLMEKESGIDLHNPSGEIAEAISVYFNNVINYTLKNISWELSKSKKNLPIFKEGVPFIISGGLVQAKGFKRKVEENIKLLDFPIKISEVRRAENPMTSVCNGALLAAQL